MTKKDDNTLLYVGVGATLIYLFMNHKYQEAKETIYDVFKGPGTPATSTENYPIVITDPTGLEKWSPWLFHDINVEITNPYNENKKIYVGASILNTNEQVIKDLYFYRITLAPGINKSFFVLSPFFTQNRGLMNVIVKTWDLPPAPGATSLGVDGSTFNYERF